MSRRGSGKEFERGARVGQLMREIVSGEVDAVDDPRLYAATITAVEVDNELEKAVVYFDADDPDAALDAFEDHGARLRRAVSDQARLRRTPRLEFKLDESVEGGGRIEDILATLDIPPPDPEDPAET